MRPPSPPPPPPLRSLPPPSSPRRRRRRDLDAVHRNTSTTTTSPSRRTATSHTKPRPPARLSPRLPLTPPLARGPKTGIHPYIATHIAHQDRPPHHGRRRGARGSFSPPYPLLALPLGEQLSCNAHSHYLNLPSPPPLPSKGKRLDQLLTGTDRAPPSRSSSSPPAAATTRTSSPSCSTASPTTKSPRSSTAP